MLNSFFRTHRLSRLQAYWRAQKLRDCEHYHRFDEKIAEFLAEIKKKKEGTGTNPKHFRSKKAHTLVEIRKMGNFKRFKKIL